MAQEKSWELFGCPADGISSTKEREDVHYPPWWLPGFFPGIWVAQGGRTQGADPVSLRRARMRVGDAGR